MKRINMRHMLPTESKLFQIFRFLAAICLSIIPLSSAQAIVVSGLNDTTPSNFVAQSGSLVNGINHDGVVEIIIKKSGGGTARGTGALLWDGRHILTAGHNATGLFGNTHTISTSSNSSVHFTFGNSASTASYNFLGGDVHLFNDGLSGSSSRSWNGTDVFNDLDIALIDLGEGVVIDPSIPRYNIYDGNTGILTANDWTKTFFGYGETGVGATGASGGSSGTKRWGLNQYDEFRPGAAGVLRYDFDNGTSARNASGGLGLGEVEGNGAPGDSGGPSFIYDPFNPSDYLIAGVTSFSESSSKDINGNIDASFGEFSGDANVSQASSWIYSIVPIPEPSTFTLLLLGAGTLFCRRKFRG